MNTLPATIALAVIAVAALISGAVISNTAADPSALWAIAGTAAGAIGGAMVPNRSSSSVTAPPVTLP